MRNIKHTLSSQTYMSSFMMNKTFLKSALAFAISTITYSVTIAANVADEQKKDNQAEVTKLDTIVLTAEEQIKQSLGASIITKEDLEKLPVVNDISEYVRRMPGVNLTGNSATGQRGNNRQIDIRGMGPENTLILVDGKPITSRNSVRYGWRGERDTRGDSNWVPADAIESIEVLRGPAAARYGSGAAGGVVNIITKKVTNELHGSLEHYYNAPEDKKEGDSYRTTATLSGPIIKDVLGFRLYGSQNKTQPDALDLNRSIDSVAAGREGVKNQDAGLRLAWQLNDDQSIILDTAFGRQGNRYSGDSQNNNDPYAKAILKELYGTETNTMYRDSYALTHEGNWAWGKNKLVAQYDKTKNKRYIEDLGGSTEGSISNIGEKQTSELNTLRLNGEVNIPFEFYVPQNLTAGVEWVDDKFTDPASTRATTTVDLASAGIILPNDRTEMKSHIFSTYIEDNIDISDQTNVVAGLRYDDHSKSGSNWSPSLNITQKLGEHWKLKGGVARAYKAPNMYQNAEGYMITTNGNGCPKDLPTSVQCYLFGNETLKPETSINKEIGVEYEKDIVKASLAWFRNDYKNKIAAGQIQSAFISKGNGVTRDTVILKWENVPEALVQGIEGSIGLSWDNIHWTNNFTYMMDSKDKSTGNPLSLVPVYTINSIFEYDVTDKLDVNFVYTQYGRQSSRTVAEMRLENGTGSGGLESTLKPSVVKSYGIAGINVGYKLSNNLNTRIGISNLFDEQKLRDSNSTSQTYNEPGRAYYASLKYQF